MSNRQYFRQRWTRYLGELRPIHDIYINWEAPSPTPSATPTLTPTITPSVCYFSSTIADSYLTAIVNAGGTGITSSVSAATREFFCCLQSNGILNKMTAIYPFIGGNSASHKFNALNPVDSDAAFRLTFNGGWTHTSQGAKPNGINAYANTYLSGNSALNRYSLHTSSYLFTQSLTRGYDLGAQVGSGGLSTRINLSAYFLLAGTPYISFNNNTVTSDFTPPPLETTGFTISNRTSDSVSKYFQNGIMIASSSVATNGTVEYPIWIGGNNNNGVLEFPSLRGTGFVSIGTGLTDSEISFFNSCVQTFQTALGRALPISTPTPTPTQTMTPTLTNTSTSIPVTPTITPSQTLSNTPSVTPSVTNTPSVTPTCGTITQQYLGVELQSCNAFKLSLWNNSNLTGAANAVCDVVVSGCATGNSGTTYCGTETILSGQHQHNFNLSGVLLPCECVSYFTVYSVTPQCSCYNVTNIPSTSTPTPTPSVTATPTLTPTISLTPSVTPSISQSTPTPTPSLTATITPSVTPSITPTCSTAEVTVSNTSLDVPITAVDFNSTPISYVSGTNFTINDGESGTFSTTQFGASVTVDIDYGACTAGQNITIVDCDSTVQCCDLNSGGGTCTFNNVNVSCGCSISISCSDGACF